jgi:hypothetical protein
VARRAFNEARDEARRGLIQRWPELLDKGGAGYGKARAEAVEIVERQVKEGKYKTLVDAESAVDSAEDLAYKQELSDSLQVRFVRLYKSVVLSHLARSGSDEGIRRRFERIVAAESKPFVSLAGGTNAAERSAAVRQPPIDVKCSIFEVN